MSCDHRPKQARECPRFTRRRAATLDHRLLRALFLLFSALTVTTAACRPEAAGTRNSTTVSTAPDSLTAVPIGATGPTRRATATATETRLATPTAKPATRPLATATAIPTTRAPAPTPTRTPSPSPSPTYVAHVVQPEETLLGIAATYGVSADALVQANDLANPNLLAQGQQLHIPPATGENVLPALPTRDYGYAIVGFSGQGRPIELFSFGQGATPIVLVGGVHGGYEWNTVLLAYQMIDYFYANQDQIPATVTLQIIPVANPDGLYLVTGRVGRFGAAQVTEPPRAARFNGRGVDLNRNWSCGWSATARWGGTSVDPGPEPFSEPETRALRDYFLAVEPSAVIFWHSRANLVAPGRCGGDSGSVELAALYGQASGYPAGSFTAYDLTGTASDWLNSQGIPAAAVELADHDNTASGQNLAGIFALLDFYSRGVAPAE